MAAGSLSSRYAITVMSGKIRIIGGQWRGRRLTVPDRAGLRPSGDRVRETLFNWLQPVIRGSRCLDLFAGTGALGLEALSRGAAEAVFVERDRELAASLETRLAQWPGGERGEVAQADALRWLGIDHRSFDLVFVDPPFDRSLQSRVLDLLSAGPRLSPGARVYLELPSRDVEPDPGTPFLVLRNKCLGGVRLMLLGYGEAAAL